MFPPCQLIKHTIQQVSNEAAWTNVTCTFTKLWSSHHHKTWGKYSKLLSFFPLRCQLISEVQCLWWITFVWETFWSDGIHVWLMSWERWTTHLRKKKKNIGEWNLAGSVFGWGSKPNCSWDKAEKLHVSIVTRKNRTDVVYIKVFPAGVPVCARTAGGRAW